MEEDVVIIDGEEYVSSEFTPQCRMLGRNEDGQAVVLYDPDGPDHFPMKEVGQWEDVMKENKNHKNYGRKTETSAIP